MIIWGPMSWMDKASCIIVEKLMWWMLIKIALKVVVKVYFDMQMDKSISYVHNYTISFEKMYTVSIKVKLLESLISKCISYSFVGSAILGRPGQGCHLHFWQWYYVMKWLSKVIGNLMIWYVNKKKTDSCHTIESISFVMETCLNNSTALQFVQLSTIRSCTWDAICKSEEEGKANHALKGPSPKQPPAENRDGF